MSVRRGARGRPDRRERVDHLRLIAISTWAFLAAASWVASAVVRADSVSTSVLVLQDLAWLSMAAVFLVTGSTIVIRRPTLSIGWLLLLPTVHPTLQGVSTMVGAPTDGNVERWLFWAAEASWAPTILPLVTLLLLVFPTGTLPSRRWRPVAAVSWLALFVLTVGNAMMPTLLDDVANPVAIIDGGVLDSFVLGPGGVLLLVAVVGSVASVVARFRQASGVERAQLRWFRAGAGVSAVGWLVAVAFDTAGRQDIGGAILGLGLGFLPVAVTMAVLRHRLWDIDRVVSRTVSWTLLNGVLVGVYALGVLGVGAVLPGDPSDLLVAGSTLAAAALARPLRRRIQGLVDRRFNRARYDADRTVEAFGLSLRDRVELDEVTTELRRTTSSAVQPASTSVWLSPTEVTA